MNTGNNLLYLIVSLLLGFMTTSGLLGWMNIRGIECSLTTSDEIYCNTPTMITLNVANTKRYFNSYLLTVAILEEKLRIISAPRKTDVVTSCIHIFSRRGVHTLTWCTVSSPFPVNFFVRRMELPLDAEIVVFPQPVGTGANPIRSSSCVSGELQHTERGVDGEMLTIADYTGVEPLKQIHWRLSARHDWFKVKELAATVQEPVILDLGAMSTMSLEERVSRAAYQINKFAKAHRKIGLRISADKVILPDTGRSHRLRLLHELARYS